MGEKKRSEKGAAFWIVLSIILFGWLLWFIKPEFLMLCSLCISYAAIFIILLINLGNVHDENKFVRIQKHHVVLLYTVFSTSWCPFLLGEFNIQLELNFLINLTIFVLGVYVYLCYGGGREVLKVIEA